MCQSHSIRTKFKLNYYTRQHFMKKFDKATNCFSIFLLTFINDFDFYQNMYRILMNMYLIIVVFSFRERVRKANVLFLTLKFHDSNFPNVVNSLSVMLKLNVNVIFIIKGKPTYVCMFTLAYVKDMSQQQKNFEFKSQNADYECRFCIIHFNNRATLNFNIVKNERYHYKILRMRKKMSQMKFMKKKNEYVKLHDLNRKESLFFIIFSALNIIVTRLSDFVYSKYDDIVKFMHILLMKVILIDSEVKSYAEQLRSFLYLFD